MQQGTIRNSAQVTLGLRLVAVRFFVIELEHSGGDVDAGGPVAACLTTMGLIVLQVVGIGLHNSATLQKKEAHLICRHTGNKSFGFLEKCSQPDHRRRRIKRRLTRKTAERSEEHTSELQSPM